MSRIKTVLGFAVGVAMLLASAAQAQSNYPNRPIRIIVPYPAGGIVDIVARAVTEQVGRDWKQTIIVEARPGGNSNIGTCVGRAQRTRRLHLAGHRPGGAGQPDALQGRWLGRAEGPQMRRPRGLEPERGAGSSLDARQHHQGVRRDRAQEAG
jgi:hypothetical protein